MRVLDLTRVVAGPYATGLLADFGARVVKVEVPRYGDEVRRVPDQVRGLSVTFNELNRNKEGLALDLRTERGREILLRLLPHFDVVTENYKAGTLAKWGLGWDALRDANPRIVYAALSGYGPDGPYAGGASYDLIAQAESGLMLMTGEPDDPPVKTGVNLADYVGGLFLAIGILCALRERDRSGCGQQVDVSNQDALVTLLDSAPSWFRATGREPRRTGNMHRGIAPYGTYQARDGWVVIGAGNPQMFRRALRAIGREELLDDEEFRERARRGTHCDEVNALWREFAAKHTRAELEEICQRGEIAFGRVHSIEEVSRDPQLEHRCMSAELPHPDGRGPVPTRGIPIRFLDAPGALRSPAPSLGGHSDAILRECLDLSDEELTALRRDGVIG
jgi:crotonobetainyl-CoA:carnitine CoA-transferase CaiB-like acyl-CoA transferase